MHREISGLREEIGYNYGYENSNLHHSNKGLPLNLT